MRSRALRPEPSGDAGEGEDHHAERVVTGHFVELAALLVEADPQPPLLVEDIAHVQAAGGADASISLGN